ncbi:MAG TPA: histidine triad nucleotide-binding protein [Novosphingobium sp.]|nr:histidine triad nucleotide-binding protein [Novosphingobium sp.]
MPIDPKQPYDDNNIFARILRGELSCTKVYEDEFAFAFNDIRPQAPVHVLVVPKSPYVSWDDFTAKAEDREIAGFMRAVGHVTRQLELDEPGYRLMVNMGTNGHQEVPHLHVHIFGGRQFFHMICD